MSYLISENNDLSLLCHLDMHKLLLRSTVLWPIGLFFFRTAQWFKIRMPTFLLYRANRYFQTISSISDLFNLNSTEVLQRNSVTPSDEILKPGREVLVPINCFCSDPFFQANVSYKVLSNTTFSELACGVFEGFLKSPILSGANPSQGKEPEFGSELQVPLRCACPDNFTTSKRVIYLVTYPFIEGDETGTLRNSVSRLRIYGLLII